MRARGLVLSTFFTVGLLVSGCDESATGNTGDQLTAGETERIVEALVYLGLIGTFEGILPDESGPFDGDLDEMNPCEGDGSVTLEATYSGDYDVETDTGEVEFEGSLSFDDCEIEVSDVLLTLNDDPGIDVEWEASADDDIFTYIVDFDGGLSFETDDDREGRCAVNLSIEIVGDEEEDELSVDLAGSVCGVSASAFQDFFEDL